MRGTTKLVAADAGVLPLQLSPSGLMDWRATIALGFADDAVTDEQLGALADLRGVPARLANRLHIVRSRLHVSLYRTGRPDLPPDLKLQAKITEFPKVLAACKGVNFGTLRGVSIVLKLVGADYADSRLLTSA